MREARVHEPNDGIARKVHGNPAAAGRDGEGEEHVDIDRLLHIRLPVLPVRGPVLRAQEKQTEEEEAEGGAEIEREQRQHRVAQQQLEPAREHLKSGRNVRRRLSERRYLPDDFDCCVQSTRTERKAREARGRRLVRFLKKTDPFVLIRDASLVIL